LSRHAITSTTVVGSLSDWFLARLAGFFHRRARGWWQVDPQEELILIWLQVCTPAPPQPGAALPRIPGTQGSDNSARRCTKRSTRDAGLVDLPLSSSQILQAFVGSAGGLIGALVGWDIREERVKHYEAGLKEGGILMGVTPRSQEEATYLEDEWKKYSGEQVTR
jgi:hypothetical protein